MLCFTRKMLSIQILFQNMCAGIQFMQTYLFNLPHICKSVVSVLFHTHTQTNNLLIYLKPLKHILNYYVNKNGFSFSFSLSVTKTDAFGIRKLDYLRSCPFSPNLTTQSVSRSLLPVLKSGLFLVD